MIPSFPSLIFDNGTDYDALHFDTIDQNGVAFHVVVARMGYTLGPCGADGAATLTARDDPAQLNQTDLYYDDDINRSVRQESDLAPFKPLCDVIVIAEAHAPQGRAVRRFPIALRVQLPDTPAPLPEPPRGLNPMQGPSPAAYAQWQAELAVAQQSRTPGAVLIDKTLSVTGERFLRKRFAPLRLLQWTARIGTLGLAAPNPWRLTQAKPTLRVPVRYEFAQGGECLIARGSAAAKRVPKKHRLTQEQLTPYPAAEAPVAHDACQSNPVGRGFSHRWFLDATGGAREAAPQIEYPARTFSARRFWQAAGGKAALFPAGLGAVGRAWLPRRQLIGHVDTSAQWGPDEFPLLPKDFDFRYWNGAPPDQQCPHLTGHEQFILTNLCAPDSGLARPDAQGNTQLRFSLRRQSLFVLGADEAGAVAVMPLAIDTVLIDLEAGQVDVVWRVCLLADGELPSVRLLHADTDEQLQRLEEWNAPPSEGAPAQAPSHVAATSR